MRAHHRYRPSGGTLKLAKGEPKASVDDHRYLQRSGKEDVVAMSGHSVPSDCLVSAEAMCGVLARAMASASGTVFQPFPVFAGRGDFPIEGCCSVGCEANQG
jgi:hypothetical protein